MNWEVLAEIRAIVKYASFGISGIMTRKKTVQFLVSVGKLPYCLCQKEDCPITGVTEKTAPLLVSMRRLLHTSYQLDKEGPKHGYLMVTWL